MEVERTRDTQREALNNRGCAALGPGSTACGPGLGRALKPQLLAPLGCSSNIRTWPKGATTIPALENGPGSCRHTPSTHQDREGQSVPATEGCTRRMRMVWWDPCRPSRYSHLTSCQLTDSPSTGKARVSMMDRRGKFIQDTNRQGNKKTKIILTRC